MTFAPTWQKYYCFSTGGDDDGDGGDDDVNFRDDVLRNACVLCFPCLYMLIIFDKGMEYK